MELNINKYWDPLKGLIENIKSRGRKYEQNVDWNYIDALNQIYNEFFFRYDKGPLLIINSNDIDFVNMDNTKTVFVTQRFIVPQK